MSLCSRSLRLGYTVAFQIGHLKAETIEHPAPFLRLSAPFEPLWFAMQISLNIKCQHRQFIRDTTKSSPPAVFFFKLWFHSARMVGFSALNAVMFQMAVLKSYANL